VESLLRIARFAHSGGMAFGVVEDAVGVVSAEPGAAADRTVAELRDMPFAGLSHTGRRWPLADVRLLAPILPSKVVGVGKNYAAHAAEMGSEPAPEVPVLFLKPSSSVVGPDAPVRLPPTSQRVDHEGELAVVIGTLAKDLPPERALDAVFGYTCANDVTARDQQRSDGQWTRAKGYDTFCPLGPWIETELDPHDLALRTELDGAVRQQSRTSLLLHDVATLVSFISGVMTLWPGDVILTGTPEGVGPMRDGQTVAVTIEGIGTLANPVVAR
jgi:2-keto-4-pentenoate hydratase/2-oxohepta-3-ene-1,7-dioic acid hydratase in catechol pathway